MRIARARARDATHLDANRTGAAAATRLKKIDPNASVAGRRPRAPRSMDPRIPRADARSDPRHGVPKIAQHALPNGLRFASREIPARDNAKVFRLR